MTIYERIKNAVQNADMETDNIDKLIAAAYQIGREEAAREICDRASEIFTQQQERAADCRYHEMAARVQGGISRIYSPDYSQDIKNTFGSDQTEL